MRSVFFLPRIACHAASKGFSLVEVTISLGIFAFALVAILGMLPVGLNTADAAFRQNDATSILTTAAASIRAMQWDGNSLKTGGWFGEQGRNLPITGTGTFYLSDDGSLINDRNLAKYTLEVGTSGDTTWPGVQRAVLTVSWPPVAEKPLGRERAVIFAHIPKKETP
jgi:uncharacterized protein (TIGR02598 family)